MKRCHFLWIIGSFEVLAVNATCSFVIVGSQAMPNSVAEKRPNSVADCKQTHMVVVGVYFAFLLDETSEHKADYGPYHARGFRSRRTVNANG